MDELPNREAMSLVNDQRSGANQRGAGAERPVGRIIASAVGNAIAPINQGIG